MSKKVHKLLTKMTSGDNFRHVDGVRVLPHGPQQVGFHNQGFKWGNTRKSQESM